MSERPTDGDDGFAWEGPRWREDDQADGAEQWPRALLPPHDHPIGAIDRPQADDDGGAEGADDAPQSPEEPPADPPG